MPKTVKTPPDNDEHVASPPDHSTVILLLGDIADTTWRMFVPTLGFTALGMWGDAAYRTEPWLALAGVLLGIGIAALLVRQQFKKVNATK